jgi:hypothetical protein
MASSATAMDFNPLPKLPKLTGEENFSEWNNAIRDHLEIHGLLGYIDISLNHTSLDPDLNAQAKLKKAKTAYAILNSTLTDPIRDMLAKNHEEWDPEDRHHFQTYEFIRSEYDPNFDDD